MSDATAIEWADSTFNPWIGCTRIGPGCDHCYAEADFDHRRHRVTWGPRQLRSRTSAANWKRPLQWESLHAEFFSKHGRHRRVFCASLADVFDHEVPAEWRADLFSLIEKTPNLIWMLLTKRIGNVASMVEEATDMIDYGEGWQSMWGQGVWPDNVWLGATICNQEEADRDIPKLLGIPAHVRFLSMEPLLGPVDLTRLPEETCASECCGMQRLDTLSGYSVCDLSEEVFNEGERIDWVIVGGESGPKARPMHPDWVRSLRAQCAAAGVPFFFKQWGEWLPGFQRGVGPEPSNFDRFQVYMFDWLTRSWRVGKRVAGRLLDRKLHDEYPHLSLERCPSRLIP